MRGKKNIRSHRPKVSRRGKNQSRFIKGKFSTDTVKARWDYSKSQHENFQRLGIQLKHQTRRDIAKINKEGLPAYKEIVAPKCQVKYDLSHRKGESNRVPGAVSQDECEYLQKLVAKHGDDYKAMSRDLKLNPYQHTQARLRRRCTRYIQWMEYQSTLAAAAVDAENESASSDAE